MLVPALTSAGMPAADALTAVLVYRIISYVLIAAIGWVVVFFLFRSRIRPDDSIGEEIDRDIASGDFNPDADPPETDGSTGSRP